ncbi:beta-lactamase family protein [Nonomuraea sp. FMUSA5-5]|uniref:Beta-lactamase family protein n=1 Tax=Nonomuraea composti TaxID=2720023 RepID=A0ABX1AZ53_9ACTN|nr:serine hydrolase domain-containing protein [Nonomuraea sp. FMUSA5-5]NJP90900.1 beta-lactamase family protein [Nonomuraea sp. FMUSA5-5]
MRDHIQRAVDGGVWPAVQFAVARHGEIQVFESFGEARDGDRFCLFSATKPIVASLVWQLIGEGLIGLETRVAEVWPEFGAHGKDVVTLEHVLLHTCGFPTAAVSRDAITSRDKRAAEMAKWRLEWQPGSGFFYHGMSAHWVLAELIHRLTGQDFRQALRDRVLDPLGLDRLELGVPVERQGNLQRVTSTGVRSVDVFEALFGQPVDEAAAEAELADVLAIVNDPELRTVGVPGAGGFSDAASMALFYQELLHNTAGLWRPDVLATATGEIRNTFPDPIRMGAPANRSIGLVIADPDDGAALKIPSHGIEVPLQPFGSRVSRGAFGHGGGGGQSAWADPATGLSFCLVTSGMDRDVVADLRRHLAIESQVPELA